MTIDERIASELRRHAPQVDEQMAWDRIESAAPLRRRGRAIRLVWVSVAALGFLVVGFILVPTLSSGPEPASDPRSPFLDTWVTTDLDGSTPTMTIRASENGAVEIVVLDDYTSVCSGAPSTMTGTGRLEGSTVFVIASPVLTCDDGSVPEALSGPPLEEQLRNLTFVGDAETDTLTGLGIVWKRESAEDPDPDPEPTTQGGMWPQSSLEEVREAQELADAGDPDYTWQVDPEMEANVGAVAKRSSPPAIVARFLREELGWEDVLFNEFVGWDQPFSNLTYIRCAPGGTNPLYPDDALAGKCAPTIDELRYETVSLDLAQLGRQGSSGIWVVTRWAMIAPFSQMVPPTAEAADLVEDFLQARIEGEGAEGYVTFDPAEVPLLYATTAGAHYERFEFEQVGGPRWPFGAMAFKVRLFAGDTVIEQLFFTPHDGRLGLEYRPNSFGSDIAPTTEDGQPVAVPYNFFDGEVTLHAAHPWGETWGNSWGLILDQGNLEERLQLLADPVPVGNGCQAGPAPADAEALAESIRSDPDLEATAPVAVSAGGAEALLMEVVAAPEASVCDYFPATMVLSSTDNLPSDIGLARGSRMRLYLFDLPEGLSTRILAIAVVAPEARFEDVVEAAAPIMDSIEFHAP